MKPISRTITSAAVTVTFELQDLGTFGSGSLFVQAREAAAYQLSTVLGIEVLPEHVRIESISSDLGGKSSTKIEVARP